MPLLNIPGSQNNLNVTISGLEPETIGAISVTEKGQALGVASLDEQGQVPTSQLPSYHVPTLTELGGEPAGTANQAIAAHKSESEPHPQYVLDIELENHINSINNPHQVTRAQLGAEPEGAENRAKTYTDQKTANFTKTFRAINPPSNPQEGDVWRQQDNFYESTIHTWIRAGGIWRSESFLTQRKLFWLTNPSDDLVTIRNWEIDLWPAIPFGQDKITIAYLKIGLIAYTAIQSSANHWLFKILGTNGSNIENFWNQAAFNENIPTQTRTEKLLSINANLRLGADLRRLRIEASAVGNPGLTLAWANLGYFYTLG